jgi:hypothetical protein
VKPARRPRSPASLAHWRDAFRAEGLENELGGFIDDVFVAAAPVPAARFFMFGALGSLVALRRRKTAA